MQKSTPQEALAAGARRASGPPARRTFVAPVVVENALPLDAVDRDPFIAAPPVGRHYRLPAPEEPTSDAASADRATGRR
jgi:hypothetical protein